MAQSALAYQQPARRRREQEQPQRPPLRVLPGSKTGAAPQRGLASLWRILFVCGIAAALITGAVLVARVGLSNAIMELHVESEQLARSIEAERAEGSRLEVQYAVATSPNTIQEFAATQLNMHPDPQVEYLRIQTEE